VWNWINDRPKARRRTLAPLDADQSNFISQIAVQAKASVKPAQAAEH
jgi:hypothetical protein